LIRVESHPATAWPAWSAAWGALAAASNPGSFFLTREWVEAWLEVFGPSTRARIVVFHEDAGPPDPAGLCILAFRADRRGPFVLRRAYLNTAGEAETDEACQEYNALLCQPGMEDAVASALATHLDGEAWDEFLANAMAAGPSLDALLRSPLGRRGVARREVPAPFVDLRPLDGSVDGYLRTLSRNTREQVRRSRRELEVEGPLRVREASSLAEARALLHELAALHTASWNARGKLGVFASPLFLDFHERLVGKAFDRGMIQLLRVAAGEATIAALYSFVHGGKANFYQSGFRLETDKRVKTGLVAHTWAIEHCRSRGLVEYDFLAGDSQYKSSLATGVRHLTWLVFRRGTVRAMLFAALRAGPESGEHATRLRRQGGGDAPARSRHSASS
jgi:CelD/BcsL family acetyltransferase involved in cellulose biosynthesis